LAIVLSVFFAGT